MREWSVSEAAKELGISERRVRALIAAGDLRARRLGRSWSVPPSAVERLGRHAPRRGRPLSARNAWALLALLAGERPAWVRPDVLSRLRGYARDPDRLLIAIAQSQPRARILGLWLPEEDLSSLDPYPLVRSGLSAQKAVARLNVVPRPGEPLEVYASVGVADQIVRRFAPEESAEDPNLIVRIPEEDWILRREEAPLPVAAADLLDHDDPRVRRAAEDALRELALAG